jgi:protein LSM14
MVNATPTEKLPFVNFPGGDIKDLFVHENQGDAAPAPAPAPAPRQQQQQKPREQKPREQKPREQSSSKPRDQQQQQQHATGTGGHLLSLRVKQGAKDAAGPDAAQGEFDFDKGLSVFNKTEELAKVGEETTSSATKYVKDDFFDSLSCDQVDRQEGRKTRVTAAEERGMNLDTFGAVALQSNYRRNYNGGRGGGRGRGGGGGGRGGGRGRGRGRGRGGYGNGNPAQAA